MIVLLVVILIFTFAFILRWLSLQLGMLGGGQDHWLWTAYGEAYRKQRKFPPDLPQYILDEAQWYPPIFPLLIAFIPTKIIVNYGRVLSIGVDLLRLAVLLYVSFYLSDYSLAAVTWAGLFYATTPLLIHYNIQLNPRVLGALFLDLWAWLFLWWYFFVEPSWLLPILVLLSALILLTHKMTTQLFWFLILGSALLTLNPWLLLFIPVSIAAAILLSGGYYLKIAKAHWDIVTFWNRNWRWFLANAIRESPIYGDPGYQTPTKFHQTGLKGALRHFSFLAGSAPSAWFLFAWTVFGKEFIHPQAIQVQVWVFLILLFAAMTVYLPWMKCLGAGHLYLHNAAFPTALLAAMLVKGYQVPLWVGVGLFGAILANITIVSFLYIRIVREFKTAHEQMGKVLDYLRDQPPGVVMCLPPAHYDIIAYKTQKPVLFGGHGYGFKKLEPTFPRLLLPMREYIESYGVRYLMLRKGYANEKFMAGISPGKMFEDGEFELYHLSPAMYAKQPKIRPAVKIVYVITGLNLGGAEIMLHKLLANINQEKFKSVVISLTERGEIGDRIGKLGIPVYSLGLKSPYSFFQGMYRLTGLLKKENPDILQTWLYHSDFLGLLAGRLAGLPRIVWNIRCSNMDMSHYPKSTSYAIKFCSFLSSFPDRIIANSAFGKTFHESIGYHPVKWDLIPNGFDLEQFKPDEGFRKIWRRRLSVSDDFILFGLIARYDPLKEHETFLEAAGLARAEGKKVEFILAGKNVDEENHALTGLRQKLGLNGTLHLLGKQEKVNELIPALDVMVSSSSSEGFPNVLGEAMACGIPCVATDAGDSAKIIGKTGFVVPPRNPEKLAEAMIRIANLGKEERKKMGESARKRIEENYDIKKISRDYETLYEEIVGSGL